MWKSELSSNGFRVLLTTMRRPHNTRNTRTRQPLLYLFTSNKSCSSRMKRFAGWTFPSHSPLERKIFYLGGQRSLKVCLSQSSPSRPNDSRLDGKQKLLSLTLLLSNCQLAKLFSKTGFLFASSRKELCKYAHLGHVLEEHKEFMLRCFLPLRRLGLIKGSQLLQ